MDKHEYEKLYSDSFSDSKGYTDFYFSKRYNGKNIEYLADQKKLICELFFFDRKLCFFDSALRASFISGACTNNSYRKQGYMAKLLSKTLNNMYLRGIEVAYLYPFLHEFYEKFSFVTFSHMKASKYVCERRIAKRSDMQLVFDIYSKYVENYNLYTIRSIDSFYEIFDGIMADCGFFYLLEAGGKIVGYNYFDSFSEQNEFVTINNEILNSSKDGFNCLLPCKITEGDKYSMIRIVNAKSILEKCICKNNISFCISDDIIMQNNVNLAFFNGKIIEVPKGEIQISISDLAKECFGMGNKYFGSKDKININFEKY